MSQKKLLLADDSITIQKVVNLTFADEGIEVITVGDGDAAMTKWTELAPDLILADVNMPGLNGYELCEKIKQSENGKKIPVVLLVGSFEPFDEEEAKRVGADDFLTKPFQSIRQLVSKVTDLLGSDENVVKSEDFSEESQPGDAVSIVSGARYNDAGMDDKMIQTNTPSGFALDEAQKFETHEVYEPTMDSAELHSTLDSTLSDGEIGENQDSSNAETFQAETEIFEKEKVNKVPSLEFDDDFLELPNDFQEDSESEKTAGKWKMPAQFPAENMTSEPEMVAAEKGANNSAENYAVQRSRSNVSEPFLREEAGARVRASEISGSASEFPPEMIEAVAQRVIEKLSDKAVREIAWEVVPQLADLIVKKMAEEKFKE